ncbi:MAG: thioredoxin [Candidatus Ranarchaeia archaeon]
MIELTDENFNDFIQSGKLVIVDFWAKWCLPCRMISPILESLSESYDKEDVLFGKMDVDKNPVTSEKYQIASIPTIAFFYNGEKIHELLGARPKKIIQKEIEDVRRKITGKGSTFDIGVG